jgi:hypothetical protein
MPESAKQLLSHNFFREVLERETRIKTKKSQSQERRNNGMQRRAVSAAAGVEI